MRASTTIIVAIIGVVTVFASHAQEQARNTPQERRIEEALTSLSPAALPSFRRATAAMDSGKHAEAEPLFREVLTAAPAFTPAMRRLGGTLIELGRDAEGLSLLRQAVQLERSPDNLLSLALGLVNRAGGKKGSLQERKVALGLAKEAARASLDPDDESYQAVVVQITTTLDDEPAFREAVGVLTRKYPHTMAAHYFGAILAATDGHWIRAEDEIREAERLGLHPQVVEDFLASGVHSRANAWRYARYAAYLLAAWALGLLLLFAGGRFLSNRTLSSTERADPNELATASELSLRRMYRILINWAGVYYYVSLPFVVVLVIGATAAVVYGFVMLGRVPIKLVVFLVIGALLTIFKMVQSLFIKIDQGDPGRRLEESEAPALWQVIREVAHKVGTRPVDEIRVTPGTEMAVYERGTASERRRDEARRILILGVGLLNDFRQAAFLAVLAHEYGHFAHRDTAGGDVALRVRRDITKFAFALYVQGQAVWWNLAFQFVRLYDFLFRRISHGATRLQEILADRMAARVYGPAAFEEGLRHVIRRSAEFEAAVSLELRMAAQNRRHVDNLYALPPLPRLSSMEVERTIADALARPTTDDDTHPGPADRFRLVQDVSYDGAPSNSTPVWDLFVAREQLTREMTAAVQGQVREAAFVGT